MTNEERRDRRAAIITRLEEINKETDTDLTHEEIEARGQEVDSLTKEMDSLDKEDLKQRTGVTKFSRIPATVTEEKEEKETAMELRDDERTNTIEYRRAFKDFVCLHKRNPILLRDATTVSSGDIDSVVIPATIQGMLYKVNSFYGRVYNRVNKTNYAPGMKIPVSNFKPTVSWVAEREIAPETAIRTGVIVFTVNKAQIRIPISLETSVMALEEFERMIADKISEAFMKEFDDVIIAGDGVTQPEGILTGADYAADNIYEMTSIDDLGEWFNALNMEPLSCRDSDLCLFVNKSDWNAHLYSLKDSNGTVAVVNSMNADATITPKFMGYDVILLEDSVLAQFANVTAGDKSKAGVFGFWFRPSDYIFNSNMQITVRQYIDEDHDDYVTKATMLADGKMVYHDSLVLITKAAGAISKLSATKSTGTTASKS